MAKKAKKHHEEAEVSEAWLLPYSDLMTLLLAVFIVLFAVSNMDKSKAEAMAQAFGGMMTGQGDRISGSAPDSPTINLFDPGSNNINDAQQLQQAVETLQASLSGGSEGDAVKLSDRELRALQESLKVYFPDQGEMGEEERNELQHMQKELDDYFTESGLESSVKTGIDERGLVVSLSSSILFDSGKADLRPENRELMIKTGDVLSKIDNYIRVEGHTDNVPISSAIYPSNWELSAARASVITRLFVDSCGVSPEKLVSVGYASYKPVDDNRTAEGRANNRRVDIIIMNSKYNALEEAQNL